MSPQSCPILHTPTLALIRSCLPAASHICSATHLERLYPNGLASSGFLEILSSIGEGWEEVTAAVEEQKMNLGVGLPCGEDKTKARRFRKPAIWSFSKERKRVVKFTVQAAWITSVVFLAKN